MPWLETDPMNERKRFILEATGGLFSHTELCLRHGVSRKTGYKWIERYESEGPDGLGDRPHRVRTHPHTTDPHMVEAALELRGQRRRWGADKIRARLLTLHPDWSVPSARILQNCNPSRFSFCYPSGFGLKDRGDRRTCPEHT